jgi:hypothetical protein
MVYWDLLQMAWDVLYWVVTYVWLFCLLVFVLVMGKTLIDLSKRITKIAKPGWDKLYRKAGMR